MADARDKKEIKGNLEEGLNSKQIEALRAAKVMHAAKTALAMARREEARGSLLALTIVLAASLPIANQLSASAEKQTLRGKPPLRPQRSRYPRHLPALWTHQDHVGERVSRTHLTACGSELSYEPTTGKSKGYAFIEYMNDAQADACEKAMDGFIIAGRSQWRCDACVVLFSPVLTVKEF
eukprot:219236-Hanusia_phi.AAC.1